MTHRALPERRTVKDALRSAGLSARQTDALLRGGWPALVGVAQAEVDELRDRLVQLERLAQVEIAPSDA